MTLTDEDIREFQIIWKRAFNEELSDSDARQRAFEIIELYAALYEPLPSERASPPTSTPLP